MSGQDGSFGDASVSRTAQAEVAAYFALSQPRLRAYVRSLVFNAADADDILQDVAVTAIENAKRYDPAYSVNAWVIGIARNRVLKYLERKKREKICFSSEIVDVVTEAAAGDEQNVEYLESLQGCLEKLEREKRELLLRRHRAGTTSRQLAQEIGYTDTRMSRLLNSLYATLMKCVAGNPGGAP